MIRFLYGDQLSSYTVLAESMFKDRADQFKRRLDWKVSVDERGCEVDQYDRLNPLYLVWEDEKGRHGGSMRFLPTVGRTMVNEHFTHLTDGVRIISPLIWECTRFCIAPGAGAGTAAALMLAACEMGLRFGLSQSVAVFDVRMPRIYARLGWSPEVIGSTGAGRDEICIGLWTFSEEVRAELSRRSGIPLSVVRRWFDASFDHAPAEAARVA